MTNQPVNQRRRTSYFFSWRACGTGICAVLGRPVLPIGAGPRCGATGPQGPMRLIVQHAGPGLSTWPPGTARSEVPAPSLSPSLGHDKSQRHPVVKEWGQGPRLLMGGSQSHAINDSSPGSRESTPFVQPVPRGQPNMKL